MDLENKRNQLFRKLEVEFKDLKENLLSLPKEELLENSYKYFFFDEIKETLITMSDELDVVQLDSLLSTPSPLSLIYDEYLKTDNSEEMENIIYSIQETVNSLCEDHQKIICIDIETTGLDKETDEILQLSIVDENGNPLFNEYFKPQYHKSWEQAEEVNHILPKMVENKPSFESCIPAIKNILENADLIVGYNNIYFDTPFIEEKTGLDLSSKEQFDVMLAYAEINGEWNDEYGSYKWKKLTECAKHYGFQFNAHNSLEDAKATAFCFKQVALDITNTQEPPVML